MEMNELLNLLHTPTRTGVPRVLTCEDGLRIAIMRVHTHNMALDLMAVPPSPALWQGDDVRKAHIPVDVLLNAINLHGGLAGKTRVGACDVT